MTRALLRKRFVMLAAIASLSLLLACALLPMGGSRRAAPPSIHAPAAVSTAPSSRPSAPVSKASSPPWEIKDRRPLRKRTDCPTDLAVKTDTRTTDTRQAGAMDDPKEWRRMKWAPGHTRPATKDFLLTGRDAIEAVISIETAHPEMIPAGFRAEVLSKPRDRALRLRMAECEIDVAAVRRRASYDAALALLLGSTMNEVSELLIESTKYGEGDTTVASCAGFPCHAGYACEPTQRFCLRPERIAFGSISKDELAVEGALSGAIVASYESDGRRRESPLWWFLSKRAHQCGDYVCSFRDYSHDGKQELVRWDIRDGGTEETFPCKQTPELEASVASQKLCRSKTGHWSQNLCLFFCDQNGAGEGCRFGCYQHCKTEASLWFKCITDRKN